MNCSCGSGKERYPIYDGHGIFLCYVCEDCREEEVGRYRSDIFDRYETDEQIEPLDG